MFNMVLKLKLQMRQTKEITHSSGRTKAFTGVTII